jgi:hypothetical protein
LRCLAFVGSLCICLYLEVELRGGGFLCMLWYELEVVEVSLKQEGIARLFLIYCPISDGKCPPSGNKNNPTIHNPTISPPFRRERGAIVRIAPSRSNNASVNVHILSLPSNDTIRGAHGRQSIREADQVGQWKVLTGFQIRIFVSCVTVVVVVLLEKL